MYPGPDSFLFGEIPDEIGLLNLYNLDLYGDGLKGFLPDNFFSFFPTLHLLNITNTKIGGKIPPINSSMKFLLINLQNNEFDQELPEVNLPDTFSSLYLDFSGNRLNGTIPEGYAKSSGYSLFLADNLLTGVIPSFPKMKELDLSSNYFDCPAPSLSASVSW